MNLVVEPFEKPRMRVRRFRSCKRKRALWKKSRVDRIVGGDPVNTYDPDGRWLLSTLKVASGWGLVINVASALNAGGNLNSWDDLKAVAMDYGTNTLADVAAPLLAAGGATWGMASSGAAFGRAITGNGNWSDVMKPLGVALWSPMVSDFNTLNNSSQAFSDGQWSSAVSSLAASGTNSSVTSFYGAQYSTNKGFGSQKYDYFGSYSDNDGYRALVWGQTTYDPDGGDDWSTHADEAGGNIRLFKDYKKLSNEMKAYVYRHEFIHLRQQLTYGVGGQFVRMSREYSQGDISSGMYGYDRQQVIDAIGEYGDGSNGGDVNTLEIEAVLKGGHPSINGLHRYDAPIFY